MRHTALRRWTFALILALGLSLGAVPARAAVTGHPNAASWPAAWNGAAPLWRAFLALLAGGGPGAAIDLVTAHAAVKAGAGAAAAGPVATASDDDAHGVSNSTVDPDGSVPGPTP